MQLNGVEPISILRAAKRVQMNTQPAQSPWTVVRKQGLLTVAGCILVGVGWGIDLATSFVVGGSCVALPSAHFAWASERTLVGSRILSQGVVKVLSTGGLMALFLGFGVVQAPWFLLGMLAGQAAYVWTLAEASRTGVTAETYVGTESYAETASKTAPVVEKQRDKQD